MSLIYDQFQYYQSNVFVYTLSFQLYAIRATNNTKVDKMDTKNRIELYLMVSPFSMLKEFFVQCTLTSGLILLDLI